MLPWLVALIFPEMVRIISSFLGMGIVLVLSRRLGRMIVSMGGACSGLGAQLLRNNKLVRRKTAIGNGMASAGQESGLRGVDVKPLDDCADDCEIF